MATGEIIAIGTELLLGEIQDTNTAYLARVFRDLGIDLFRTTIVGDNYERIAQSIREALERSQIIITTGGLGPTVDDPTRQAIAHALGVDLEYHSELWKQIEDRFKRYGRQPTINNRRQAYIPAGAVAIENPVGTAPAFYFDTGDQLIISLPGVPREMETILQHSVVPLLRSRFNLQEVIKAYVLHAAGVGESQVDEWIADLEEMKNPTVGLSAHPGVIDIRITAKASSQAEADSLIADCAAKIHQRVGVAIFGAQSDTLEKVVMERLSAHKWKLAIAGCGLTSALANRLIPHGFPAENYLPLDPGCSPELLESALRSHQQNIRAEVALGAGFYPGQVQQNLSLFLTTPAGSHNLNRSYGGPPDLSELWAVNTALDFIRRNTP